VTNHGVEVGGWSKPVFNHADEAVETTKTIELLRVTELRSV
jgi:hypothetical protein